MAVFGLQAVTGIVLAMYYKPEPTTAYASIQDITNHVTWGWLVRGMHKWGASAMIILVFLHMARVFIFGSYKYPRELTWVTGALLLIMVMFMGLTGYLLVWDQQRLLGDGRRHEHHRQRTDHRPVHRRHPSRRHDSSTRIRSRASMPSICS